MKPPTDARPIPLHTASARAAAPVPASAVRPRWRDRLLLNEDLNFLFTNRVPRLALTQAMGWFSRLDSPLLTRLSIAVWRQFTDLDFADAAEPHRWRSLRECFIRALKPGARPVDADPTVLVSPCDAIVGACGTVRGTQMFQAKGLSYPMGELLGDESLAHLYRGGTYATLRLTSSMYHRFHAPLDARLVHARYLSGDTWNVNPIALKRIEKLFCRNERAVLQLDATPGEPPLLLVPVAAILVASLRVHALDALLNRRWTGPSAMRCDVAVTRGQEMGWFEHGSTIIVVAPRGHALCPGIVAGARLRMGERLMTRPAH